MVYVSNYKKVCTPQVCQHVPGAFHIVYMVLEICMNSYEYE